MAKGMAAGLAAGVAMLMGMTAEVRGEGKEHYSLVNPTPDRLLRDMTTDRPDTTESPFTVDAGRVQVETNLFGYARSRRDVDGTITDTYEFATTNIRIGLTSSAEINFVLQPYGIVSAHPVTPAAATRSSGVGGLDIRAKFNLWGNDTFEKSGSALALLPFVTLPTDRNNGISPEFVEGGLIVPLAVKLADKFGLGLNGGIVYTRDSDASGYRAEYLSSASLAYEWSEKLGSYYEVAARFHTEDPRGDIVVLGTGVTYKFNKNVQFDAGVNFGVTSAADRVNPFIGLATRF